MGGKNAIIKVLNQIIGVKAKRLKAGDARLYGTSISKIR
jgi:hypothetical protein